MKIPACPYCGFRGYRIVRYYYAKRGGAKLNKFKAIRCRHCWWTSRLSRFWWIAVRRWRLRDGSMTLRRERHF